MKAIDVELVKSLLEYNISTGLLTWKPRPASMFKTCRAWKTWNTRYAGSTAGAYNEDRVCVAIRKSLYSAHRVVWSMIYDEQPPDVIDHYDGNPHNNRLSNLRPATTTINTKNRAMSSNNTSGVCGVHFNTSRQKWVAQGYLTVDGKQKTIPLGRYDSKEAAVYAREQWIETQPDYTKRHGK